MSCKKYTEEFRIEAVKQVTERFAQGSHFSSSNWRDFSRRITLNRA